MTVTQILEGARNSLNALNDTLWTDSELLISLYRVMLRAAKKTRCISTSATQSTVAGTAAYTAPAYASEIWRVTYEGRKLQPIDRREYDSVNPNAATSSGSPTYYLLEGETITLYPTPGAIGSLVVYYYGIPTAVPTSSTTLEIPARYHDVLMTGLTAEMCPKDVGNPLTVVWSGRFERELNEMEAHVRKARRGDAFAVTKIEEISVSGEFGIV